MKQHVTIALHTDGTSEMIHGPEVPAADQRQTVQGFRDSDVPEGIERVEIWSRTIVKFAYRKPETLKRREELAALIEADRAKQDGTGDPAAK